MLEVYNLFSHSFFQFFSPKCLVIFSDGISICNCLQLLDLLSQEIIFVIAMIRLGTKFNYVFGRLATSGHTKMFLRTDKQWRWSWGAFPQNTRHEKVFIFFLLPIAICSSIGHDLIDIQLKRKRLTATTDMSFCLRLIGHLSWMTLY